MTSLMQDSVPIPVIKDWDAIDSLAYCSRGEQNICPLCGVQKGRWLVCSTCMNTFGDRGLMIVKAEIGIRKLFHWPDLVGANLSSLCGGKGNGRKISRAVKGEEITPPVISFESSEDNVADVIKEDFQIEIMPGMKIWNSAAKVRTSSAIWERIACPVCRGSKNIKWWLCPACLKKFGSRGLFTLKTYLAKFNSSIIIYDPEAHIPEALEGEELARKTYALNLVRRFFYVSGLDNPKKIAEKLFYSKRAGEDFGLLVWAAKKILAEETSAISQEN